MMKKSDLINQLSKMKEIEPDSDFALGTKRIIIATKRADKKSLHLGVWGFGFALLFLAIISSGFLFPTEPKISLLDSEIIKSELGSINLQLEEVEYNQRVNTTISSALGEISTSQTKHLNPTILELERQIIENSENGGSEIDKMLDSIIF